MWFLGMGVFLGGVAIGLGLDSIANAIKEVKNDD